MFLGKYLRWSLPMWSKALCLNVSEPTAWLTAQRKAQALLLEKQAFFKEKKTAVLKKSVNSFPDE